MIVIVILGSALLIIAVSTLIIGLNEREAGFAAASSGETRALADGCMDEAYMRIRRNPSWGLSGPILFTAPNGSCSIVVSDLGGSNRQIDVTASHAEYTAHIRSTHTIGTSVNSWEERSD